MEKDMNLPHYLDRMQRNAAAVEQLATGLAPDQARWKPTPADWSILEVINHLYDEEREDFRTRVDLTLHQPDTPWPPINPGRWVTERGYLQRDPSQSLANFLAERRLSLDWLSSLQAPAWERARHHPELGSMSAGELLACWVAHDYLHIRQLNELHYAYHAQSVAPLSVRYAGSWEAE
jgi:hypothetical protein